MYEAGVESRVGGYRDCSGTVSGARSHDSTRQPHHRAVCARRFSGVRGGPEEGQVSVKAVSVAEHSEIAAQKNTPGAVRGPIRLAKLLRGIEVKGATAHGDLEIAQIAYDSRKANPGALFVAIRGEI